MLSKEINQLLTQTTRGTPAGELLRRYWQPAALAEELPLGGAPVPVRLLGEDLVLFRDAGGRPGLLGLHCSHRGADLSYGRLEEGGLRCIYHGWLYDIQGRCLEQPGEPVVRQAHHERSDVAAHPEPVEGLFHERSDVAAHPEPGEGLFHERIRHLAYPCVERAGVIFAYLGPGEPPIFPDYPFLSVPDEHVFAVKLFSACNWLQGNEGNLDSIHSAFLHYTRRDLGRDGGVRLDPHGRAPGQESVEMELTEYGLRVCRIRLFGEQKSLNLGMYIFPCAFAFGGRPNAHSVNWHVPIDDTSHWKYTFIFDAERALDKEVVRRGRAEMTADYQPIRRLANRYLQDRSSMQTESYSGIGLVNQPQDFCVTEGAGPIYDRTQEHLGAIDIPLVVSRNLLLKAIEDVCAGRDPPFTVRDASAEWMHHVFADYRPVVPLDADWRAHFQSLDVELTASRSGRAP